MANCSADITHLTQCSGAAAAVTAGSGGLLGAAGEQPVVLGSARQLRAGESRALAVWNRV